MPSGPPICQLQASARPRSRRRLYWVAYAQGGWRRQDGQEVQGQDGGRSGVGFWDDYRANGVRGTEALGALNPELCRWLHGFPAHLGPTARLRQRDRPAAGGTVHPSMHVKMPRPDQRHPLAR